MRDYLKTGVVPLPDETLMSFLTRVAIDLCMDWKDYMRSAVGETLRSARYGELRHFDWLRLAEAVQLSPDTLFEMSGRSFIFHKSDSIRCFPQRFRRLPWLATNGYPVYSPAALGRSDHLRCKRPFWHVVDRGDLRG